MPITAQVVKHPSARALALGRGLWEPKNRMVRRSKGGAIEPPIANTISPGRRSLMNILLAVVLLMRNRIADAVQTDDTEEWTTTVIWSLCQRGLPLR